MEKVIIYSRVSTQEQADKGYSLRDQLDRLEKYCTLKNYQIVKHYQEDHSAKTFDRPEFKKLLDFVKHNKRLVDRLLIMKWDRFSRNATDALNMLRTLDNLGVEVNAVEQPIDMSIPENKLLLSFFLVSPEIENDRRAMNVINGMRRAMHEGRWISVPPVGYKFIYDEKQKPLLVKSEKAPLIKKAFELVAEGNYCVEEVRKLLLKKGLQSQRSNFARLLKNPVYCGKIAIKGYKNEHEEIVKGIHEGIVSEELFYQVQDVLSGKKKSHAKPAAKSESLPLRGFLVCPDCGRILTGSASKGRTLRYHYYHCQRGCSMRVKADIVHSSFSEWLGSFNFKPEIAELYLAIVEDVFKSEEADRITEMKKIKQNIEDVNANLLKVERKYVSDEIERDTFIRLKESYKQDEMHLRDLLADLQIADADFMKYMTYGCSVLSNLRQCYDTADLDTKQKLIGSIFPEKLVFENGSYRTTKESEMLRLLCWNGEGLLNTTPKKMRRSGAISNEVGLLGIEPRTT